MKKSITIQKMLTFLSITVFLASCSSVGQISLTKSRYGNGIGLSFDKGLSKADQKKLEDKTAIIKERAKQRSIASPNELSSRFLQGTEIVKVDLTEEKPEAVQEELIEFSDSKNAVQVLENLRNVDLDEGSAKVKVEEVRKSVLASAKSESGGLSDESTLLLVILALLLSPVAVYLYEGSWTNRVTLNLILYLLCGLPGVIHALVVILGNK